MCYDTGDGNTTVFFVPTHKLYINSCFASLISFSLYQLGTNSVFHLFLLSQFNIPLAASRFLLIKHRRNHDYEYEEETEDDGMRWSVCNFEVLQYTT